MSAAEQPARPTTWADFRRAVRAQIARELAAERAAAAERTVTMRRQLADGVAAARARGARGDIWLFGSYARGTPEEQSDVDIAYRDVDVDVLATSLERFVKLPIHYIDLATAAPSLTAHIAAEGQPL